MRPSSWLLLLTAVLGIGLFLVMFVWPPELKPWHYAVWPKVYLPQAADRALPLPVPAESQRLEMVFVGDIMLARDVERTIVANGPAWPMAKLGEVFSGADLVLGNLESTVRPTRNLEVVNQMTFDTTPDNLEILKHSGFTHLSLANNHSDDFGAQVTLETRQAVIEAGFTALGDPAESEMFIARENLNGLSVSIVGYHAFGDDLDQIIEAVTAEERQGRFVIVYPHWGPEYVEVATDNQVSAAELLVAAGADLIVGAHPHVIQNYQLIENTPVVYSLGNFLFDQDFSLATQQGLILKVSLTPDLLELNFVPISIANRQAVPLTGLEAQAVLTAHGLGNGNFQITLE